MGSNVNFTVFRINHSACIPCETKLTKRNIGDLGLYSAIIASLNNILLQGHDMKPNRHGTVHPCLPLDFLQVMIHEVPLPQQIRDLPTNPSTLHSFSDELGNPCIGGSLSTLDFTWCTPAQQHHTQWAFLAARGVRQIHASFGRANQANLRVAHMIF